MDAVRRIADAVLYEGYLLWPYRRSALKNQRRWTFGGVFPRAHSAEHPDDRWVMRTECLLQGEPEVDVRVRFLQVVDEHGVEREVGPGPIAVGGLQGTVDVGATAVADGLWRIAVEIANTTPFSGTREEALERSFCSTHTILRAARGAFVSLTDPPDELREAAAACRNEGTWPVLVEDHHTMLSSPIILEDHPRIAPESPGDLFDGGEIDGLLTLSILSMTDEEKAQMRAADPRTREILERTEALTGDDLMRLHGAIRDLRVVRP
jgi:hypothetical protein